MTENISAYNDEAILPIEDILENVLFRYGATVVPLNNLKLDWSKINNLIILSLREFEQWVPRLKWYEAPKVRTFTMPDDCQEVRSVVLNTPGVLYTDMPVLQPNVDYTYNKHQNEISAYLTGLKVQYLSTHTLAEHNITTEEEYVVKNVDTIFKIKYVPKPGTISIITENSTELLDPVKVSSDFQEYKFSEGLVNIDLTTMDVCVNSNISGNIKFNYTSKYKGICGITQGEQFLEAMFAEKLLTSIGNIKAVCNFATMPVNITADDLKSLGQSIHTEVENYCANAGRQKWWLGITAIS